MKRYRDNPRLIKYVFLTTEIEMEKKEIAISKYFEEIFIEIKELKAKE